MEGALLRDQREQRRVDDIRALRLPTSELLLGGTRVALDNAGFGGSLMGVNHLAGADCGMQDESREYQREEPEPQPCSQRAFSPDGS
jgi:hypothetical protein